MQKFQSVVQDTQGNVIANADVEVFQSGGAVVAAIFSDNGITPLANPFQADALGVFFFYAADGRYDVKITYQTSTAWRRDILLDDTPALAGTVNANNVTVIPTGNLTSTNVQQALIELQNDIDAIDGGTF